jgi:hypothetical protein
VYWQDNVWPGFDAYGRNWMVEQYLDGVHLQALAVNGDDRKIYLYQAREQDWLERTTAKEIWKQREAEEAEYAKREKGIYKKEYEDHCKNKTREECGAYHATNFGNPERAAFREYLRINKEATKRIVDRCEVYDSPDKLPPMRYRVDFNTVKTGYPASRLLHTDEITITDVEKNKEIAFSRRYMAYAFWLTKFSGNQPDFSSALGDWHAYEFDDKVLFEYAGVIDALELEKETLDKRTYRLYHN